ncbi:MAG: hypothetical protein ACE15F_19830, partial [bacterium]
MREGPAGQIWALNYDDLGQNVLQISHYVYQSNPLEGQWLQYGLPDWQAHGLLPRTLGGASNFLPSGSGRLLLLLLDRLVEFDEAAKKAVVLKTVEETHFGTFIHMTDTVNEGLWITTDKGVVKASGDGHGNLPSPGAVRWEDFVCPEELGLRDFAYPVPVRQGEIFCTASPLPNERRVLVRFDGTSWTIIHSALEEDVIMGWAGVDGIVWVLKAKAYSPAPFPSRYTERLRLRDWISPTLSWIGDGTERRVDRRKTLLGRINQVAVAPNGVFWAGTSRGPVRYAPPAWRLPPDCPTIEEAVYAAHEDRPGRLWFSATDTLLGLENGHWQSHRLPEGKAFPIHTVQSLGSLPDGRIVFVTRDGSMLTMKPGSEEAGFHSIEHPEGRMLLAVVPRADGRLWVVTGDRTLFGGRLEIFDGTRFETFRGEKDNLTLGSMFVYRMIETSSGDLWFAGNNGIGWYANGEYRKFDAGDDECLKGYFYSLVVTGDGKLWAGGENKIVEFDGHAWKIIGGPGFGNVNNLLRQRDGTVWAAATRGIYRYAAGSWIANSDEEGLPAEHGYMLFEDSQDRLWAGTASGFALYHPEADPDPPETCIPLDKNLAVASPGGDVRLLYAGMDRWKYTPAERLLFSFRFDENPWEPFMPETVAAAAGMSPGTHRFAVRAADRNGNIDPTPAVFEFSVPLHWYRHPAFLILFFSGSAIILVLLSLHLYHYFNLEFLVTQRTADLLTAQGELLTYQDQLRALASETSLIEERERRKLATDLHDRISQTLSLSHVR